MGLDMKYFVLSPKSSDRAHAIASRNAMLSYAACIAGSAPDRANDIREWVFSLPDMGMGDACGPAEPPPNIDHRPQPYWPNAQGSGGVRGYATATGGGGGGMNRVRPSSDAIEHAALAWAVRAGMPGAAEQVAAFKTATTPGLLWDARCHNLYVAGYSTNEIAAFDGCTHEAVLATIDGINPDVPRHAAMRQVRRIALWRYSNMRVSDIASHMHASSGVTIASLHAGGAISDEGAVRLRAHYNIN